MMSNFMKLDSRIDVAGHRGLAGSAVQRSTVARVLEFEGTIIFDTSKPDGTPRKAPLPGHTAT